MDFLRLTLVVCSILAFGAVQGRAEPRVALVIGNSEYGAEMGKLPNPANDAALMAKALKQVGFEVISVTNADQGKMKQAIKEFGRKLIAAGTQSTGLFFYAGHGLQVDGENYLIPVRAAIEQENDVDVEAIPASMVLKQMDFSGSSVNIVILDACRNNPLARSMRSATRGLAEIKERPTGSFIAYSTAPGQTAVDGKGKNSPYTEALAAALVMPGAGIEEVFRTVRGKVLKETGEKQVPWDASSLTAPFYFMPGSGNGGAASAAGGSGSAAAVDPRQIELAYWESIKDSSRIGDYDSYLKKYPDGDFADLAKSRIADLKEQKAAGDGDATQRTTAGQGSATAASSAAPEFESLDQAIYAKGGAVVRVKPASSAATMMKVGTNQELHATGVATDGTWWRVRISDGRTGYIHKSVVSESSPQVAAAAPSDASGQDAGSGSFIEPIAAGSAQAAPQTYQAQTYPQQQTGATITFGGTGGNAQLGGIGALAQIIGSSAANSQAQQTTVKFSPQSRQLMVRSGALIRPAASYTAPPIARLTADGPLQGAAQSTDGLWWRVRLPDGRTGFIEANAVIE